MYDPAPEQEAFHLAILEYLRSVKYRKSRAAFETESGLREIADRPHSERAAAPNILLKRWRASRNLQILITSLEERIIFLEHQRNVFASILGMELDRTGVDVTTPLSLSLLKPLIVPCRAGVALSNTFPVMAVHFSDLVIRFFSTNDWTPLPIEDLIEEHPVSAMAFAPDGISLIVATSVHVATYQLGSNRRFVPAVAGRLLSDDPISDLYPFKSEGSDIRWNFVSRSKDSIFQLWHSRTDKVVKTLRSSLHKNAKVACVVTKAARAVLVLGLDNGQLAHWNLLDDDEHAPNGFEAHDRSVDAVCALSASARADYISSGRDCKVRLWLLESQTCVAELSGHNAWIRALVARWDDKVLLSAGDDGFVKRWDLVTDTCSAEAHVGVVKSLHFDYLGARTVAVPVKGGLQATEPSQPGRLEVKGKERSPVRDSRSPEGANLSQSILRADLSTVTTTTSDGGPPLQLPCPKITSAAVSKGTSPQKKSKEPLTERLRKTSGLHSSIESLREQGSSPLTSEATAGGETQRRGSGEAFFARLQAQRVKSGGQARAVVRKGSIAEPSPRTEVNEAAKSNDSGAALAETARKHSAGSDTRRSQARDFSQRHNSQQTQSRKATMEESANDPIVTVTSRRSSADKKRLPHLSRNGTSPTESKNLSISSESAIAKPPNLSPAASPTVSTKRIHVPAQRNTKASTTSKTTVRAESDTKRAPARFDAQEAKTTRARPDTTRARHGFSDPLGADNRSPASTTERILRPSLVERGAAYAAKKDVTATATTRRSHT